VSDAPDLHFADLDLGQRLPPVEHEVTQAVIDQNAVAHLDFNPVHTDLGWAERAQVFGGPGTVAHGMFTIAVMASVIDRAWRHGGASIRSMRTTLTKPVPPGQVIRAEAVVTELHPLGPGRSEVLVKATATDGDGDVVGVGSFRVRVPD
jgi:acyl dehydratase